MSIESLAFGDWIQIFVVVVTALIAGFTFLTARSVNQTSRAALFENLIKEYRSSEMSFALQTLGNWRQSEDLSELSPNDVLDISAGDETYIRSMDAARRQVYWFFRSAFLLWKRGNIDRSTMKFLSSTNGYQLFLDVAVPLSKLKHSTLKGVEPVDLRFSWADEFQREFPPIS
ncbi:MAG: hypothetical protein SGJ07_04320 [Rhodospirillaceae bacterium]|nr:hypothetical protein [Rhodospirillaceae bacterium]